MECKGLQLRELRQKQQLNVKFKAQKEIPDVCGVNRGKFKLFFIFFFIREGGLSHRVKGSFDCIILEFNVEIW